MKLNLGIVYKDGKVINHRSLLKVLLNPILRYVFGIQIVSYFDNAIESINSIGIMKSSKRTLDFLESWVYDATDCLVSKKRIWF